MTQAVLTSIFKLTPYQTLDAWVTVENSGKVTTCHTAHLPEGLKGNAQVK